jgi:hypothetical protein
LRKPQAPETHFSYFIEHENTEDRKNFFAEYQAPAYTSRERQCMCRLEPGDRICAASLSSSAFTSYRRHYNYLKYLNKKIKTALLYKPLDIHFKI